MSFTSIITEAAGTFDTSRVGEEEYREGHARYVSHHQLLIVAGDCVNQGLDCRNGATQNIKGTIMRPWPRTQPVALYAQEDDDLAMLTNCT